MKLRNGMQCLQHGSIVITTAIALSLIVICLIGTELGYLFFMKREFQKTADLAALAGAKSLSTTDCKDARSAARSNANNSINGNMPSHPSIPELAETEVICGSWTSKEGISDSASRFAESTDYLNAVQVNITRTTMPLIPFFEGNRTIRVTATAAKSLPRASLAIRSTLAKVDTSKSALLNSTFTGLLGGNVALDAVGWNGLLNTDVQLLNYLDQLALKLNVGLGQYDKVLTTQTSVGNLVNALIDALKIASPNTPGTTASVAIVALERIAAGIPSAHPLIELGDILEIQSGTTAAGLDVGVQVFQLAQAVIQAANRRNGLAAEIPITIGGLAVNASVTVVEPPQFSMIGNPELIKNSPLGENKIYVRTASLRTLLSLDLVGSAGVVQNLSSLLSDISLAAGSILRFIINLDPPVECKFLGCRTAAKAVISNSVLLPFPARIDINVDIANAESYITDFDCSNPSSSELNANGISNIATVRIGKLGTTPDDARANVFSSLHTPPTVTPIPIIDIGTVQARSSCALLILLCSVEYLQPNNSWESGAAGLATAKRTPFGGGGLALSAIPPASPTINPSPLNFYSETEGQLLEIDDKITPQTFLSLDSNNSATSAITNILLSLKIKFHEPTSSTGILGAVLTTTNSVVTTAFNLIQPLVTSLMTSIADPLIALLLNTLGIDLGAAKIGGRLSCTSGAELVY